MSKLRNNDSDFFTGTSQLERRLSALMPENLRIDEREMQDLLNELYAIAAQIRFPGTENSPVNHWAAFLEKSPAFLLAAILNNKPGEWAGRMREIIQYFYRRGGDTERIACNQAVQLIKEMFLLIDSWYVRSEAMKKWKEKTALNLMLEQAIRTDLQPALRQFKGLLSAMDQAGLMSAYAETKELLDQVHALWKIEPDQPAFSAFSDDNPDNHFLFVIEALRQLFQRLLFFMNLLEKKAGQWFEETLEHQQDHDPHIGLLMAFLQLFLHARDQLNAKPLEHLHYYYFDILKQALRPHTPDQAIVCFQLSDHITEHLIEKGTRLLADINADGVASTYAAVQDLWATRAQVAELRSLHVAKNSMIKTGSSYKLVTGIYAAPVANSQDGLGKPFHSYDRSWPTFGEEQLDKSPAERRMVDARVGFILASPVLWLQEGERTIYVRFEFAPAAMARFFDLIEDIAHNTSKKAEDIAAKLFYQAFLVDVSTPEGWMRIKRWQVDSLAEWKANTAITLTAYLSIDDPPISACPPEVLTESYNTQWPLLRVCLNPDSGDYLYSFLHGLELETVTVDVEVAGMKNLQMSSDLGPLDASAPFMPFGPIPVRNANLIIGNAELFKKRLTALSFQLEWNRVPETAGGFAEYYRAYEQDINNESFQVRLSALSSYAFRPAEPKAQQVFHLFSASAPDAEVAHKTVIEGIKLDNLRLHPDYSLAALGAYSNSARTGYFKLQLSEPAGGFGHADYHRLFTTYLLSQTAAGKKGAGATEAPAEPFVPILNQISINYKASSKLNLRPLSFQENDVQADEKIIALYPFGHKEIFAGGKGLSPWLFPRFEEDGYLYIGLKEAAAGKPLTLYFQMQESILRQKPLQINVTGSYLQAGEWVFFTEEQTLSNTTRGFATSGIVALILPELIDLEHTLMPSGFFWIRVAAKGNLEPIGRIIAVYPNAVEVVWEDNGDESHFDREKTLPLLKTLLQPRSEIAAVQQPGPFYGGNPKEKMVSFYIRTSERLKHKNRGVLTWDIERLILQEFPFVRRAKCITPMLSEEVPAGKIRVVVIPQADETDLTPMLGFYQLRLISQFLESRLSPFAQIEVINPVYEKIKVTCSVILQKGLEHERGKYLQVLHEDLKDFICPWLKAGSVAMGGSISKNEVLAFISSRPYLRFVTGFSMVHIYDVNEQYTFSDTASAAQSTEILYANTPWSILIPVEMHQIELISRENNVLPDVAAIDEMRLGTDFIIMLDEDDGIVQKPEDAPETFDGADESDESFLVPIF